MPSINTMLTGLAVTAFSLLQVVSAVPTPQAPAAKKPAPAPVGVAKLPVNGGASELPAPTTALVAVAIGRGIQNYTCTAVGAVPTSIGAIATLFDVTSLAKSDAAALNKLTADAVNVPAGRDGCFSLGPAGARFPQLGKHSFLADVTPYFVLTGLKKSIQAKKLLGITAPATAAKGPAGTGAVDWLQLGAKPAPYVSVGLSTVYRVETAGGMQTATCAKAGTLSVQYAAQYFFYA